MSSLLVLSCYLGKCTVNQETKHCNWLAADQLEFTRGQGVESQDRQTQIILWQGEGKSSALTTRPRRLLRCFFFLREDSVLCNNQWLQISDASNIVVQFFDSSCVVSRVEKSWFWLKPQSILLNRLNGLCIFLVIHFWKFYSLFFSASEGVSSPVSGTSHNAAVILNHSNLRKNCDSGQLYQGVDLFWIPYNPVSESQLVLKEKRLWVRFWSCDC